jgi:rhodanese-related sulfurtransferase
MAGQITDVVRRQPEATIVVNCAGRTRSIIGARLLQRMGIANVVSLQNGTAGWTLAGLELEHGAQRTELEEPSAEGRTAAAAFAQRCAEEDGVRLLAIAELRRMLARRQQECVYLVDVRREEEFAAGHIPGSRWFPGGQAVQRSDDVAAVRSAAIVFASNEEIRSCIVASWYRQMGFPNVFALAGGVGAWRSAGLAMEEGSAEPAPWGLAEASAHVAQLEPDVLLSRLAGPRRRTVLFVDPSDAFARGHVPGATWLPRGWLELRIAALVPDRGTPLAVTDRTGEQALLAAATLGELGYHDVAALAGGMERWRAAGLPLEQGLSGIMSPPEDVVPSGPDRSHAGMIHYLSWEQALGRKYEEAGA